MRKSDRPIAIAFILPSVIIMSGLILYPLLYSMWLSLNAKDAFTPETTFVGLQNFKVLLNREDFWMSLKNGGIFAGSTVFLQVLFGLAIALVLNQNFIGRGLARGIMFFPFVVPTIVAVMVWKWVLNDLYGVFNYLLFEFNIIKKPIVWFGSPDMAMVTVILINIWKWFPFVVVAFLARLTAIPQQLYEAAKVDGASAWQSFIYITLPQLKTIILIVILIRGIWMFNKFDIIYLLTQGGPMGATQHLPILAYLEAFRYYKMGMGAAVSFTIFILLCISTSIYLRIYRIKEMD